MCLYYVKKHNPLALLGERVGELRTTNRCYRFTTSTDSRRPVWIGEPSV
jgi:hypothetical protein